MIISVFSEYVLLISKDQSKITELYRSHSMTHRTKSKITEIYRSQRPALILGAIQDQQKASCIYLLASEASFRGPQANAMKLTHISLIFPYALFMK